MTKETKMVGGEGKALAAEMMATFEAYKNANDERLDEIESKGASDTLLDEKLRKLDKRLDALSLKAAQPDVAVSPDVAEHNEAWSRYLRVGPDETTLSDRGIVGTPASIGRLLVELPAGPLGRWDEAASLEVDIQGAEFPSLSELSVLNGAGLVLVQGQAGWELLAYRDAVLVDDNRWLLTGLLRGLAGSGHGGAVSGSTVVLVDENVLEVPLAREEMGLSLLWTVGNSVPIAAVFDDLGRLPWSVGHLQALNSGTDWHLTWTKRGAEISENWSRPESANTGNFRIEVLLDGGVVETIEASTGFANISFGGDQVRVAEIGDDGRMGTWASIPLLAA